MAETIDNLPPDANNRWARDQEILASSPHVKEDRFVAGAQIDVTEPAYPSELTTFIGQDLTGVRWAAIDAPPIYAIKKRSGFFSENLMPWASNEKLESIKERLKSLPEASHGQ